MKAWQLVSAIVASMACGSAFGQLQLPHRFSSGAPARAAEVNENFDALATAVNANTAAIRNLAIDPAGPAAPTAHAASVATVAAIGGHYATPQEALDNLSDGDAWCRDSHADPAAFPCAISIAPGIYDLPETLVIPPFVAVIGYGPKSTVLRALPGVAVAVQAGTPPTDFPANLGIALRDIAVQNTVGGQSDSVALQLPAVAGIEIVNVRAEAQGPNDSTAVRVAGGGAGTLNRIEWLEASAAGSETSIGLHLVSPGSNSRVDGCRITAAAGGTNVGVENGGFATLSRCEITAIGGHTAVAVRTIGEGTTSNTAIWINNSQLRAREATNVSTGFHGRSLIGAIFNDLDVDASGSGDNTGVWLSMIPPFGEGYFDGVRARASGGTTSAGMYNVGGHHDPMSMTVERSSFSGIGYGGSGYGIRFDEGTEGPRLRLLNSTYTGSTASMFYGGPARDVWETGGPPLTVYIGNSKQQGPLSMRGHFVKCVATFDLAGFYPSTCPPSSVYTPSPF